MTGRPDRPLWQTGADKTNEPSSAPFRPLLSLWPLFADDRNAGTGHRGQSLGTAGAGTVGDTIGPQGCPGLSPALSGDCGHEGPPERLPDSGGRMPIVPGRLFSSCAQPPAYKKDMCTLWQHQLCAQTAARFAGMLGINAETSLQKDLSCVNRSSLDSFLHLPLPEAIAIPFIPWTVCGKKDTVFLSFPFIQEFVLCKDASSSA